MGGLLRSASPDLYICIPEKAPPAVAAAINNFAVARSGEGRGKNVILGLVGGRLWGEYGITGE